MSRTIGRTRQPELAVPFNRLTLDGRRTSAKHGVPQSCPVQTAQTVGHGVAIGGASYCYKHGCTAGAVSAPFDMVACCQRSVSTRVPRGAIVTVGERIRCIGTTRHIQCSIVLHCVDGGERDIGCGLVPVDSIVAESQRISTHNESGSYVFTHRVSGGHRRVSAGSGGIRCGVVMNVGFGGDCARIQIVGRVMAVADFKGGNGEGDQICCKSEGRALNTRGTGLAGGADGTGYASRSGITCIALRANSCRSCCAGITGLAIGARGAGGACVSRCACVAGGAGGSCLACGAG
jgi:hypothetical protein